MSRCTNRAWPEASPAGGTLPGQDNRAGWTVRGLRVLGRLAWLAAEFVLAALRFPRAARCDRAEARAAARARWLQQGSRRILRVLGVRRRVHGPIPTNGLLVCNHLGYLDVLVLAAVAPAIFVAKQEVRRWPIIGWFARAAGTVFIRREQRRDILRVNASVESHLRGGALVVVFPEATSSDGRSLRPFKSSLLGPALQTGCPIWVGRLDYALEDGRPEEDACYWGDMTLLPHLLSLLGKRGVDATARFAGSFPAPRCRKALAGQLHSAVRAVQGTTGRTGQ